MDIKQLHDIKIEMYRKIGVKNTRDILLFTEIENDKDSLPKLKIYTYKRFRYHKKIDKLFAESLDNRLFKLTDLSIDILKQSFASAGWKVEII